ncbi:MAG: hypothetical protein ACK487_00220, partial [Sphingomonadales bacterium]
MSESSSGQCGQALSGSITITINTNPTAQISGSVDVCKDATPPLITFSGADGTAPFTFTYNINGGAAQTISTTAGTNTGTLAVPTGVVGAFVYNLTGVIDINNTVCAGSPSGSVTINVNPLPTASISGSTSVCLNAPEPLITFTGAGTSAPYTFFYSIDGGSTLSVTTTGGNTATVAVPTATAGTYTYTLLSVTDGTATTCSQPQSGSAAVTVWPLPQAAYTTS